MLAEDVEQQIREKYLMTTIMGIKSLPKEVVKALVISSISERGDFSADDYEELYTYFKTRSHRVG